MNIIVFGPTGGTGRAVMADLLAGGQKVTAFARDPSKLLAAPGLIIARGDAMNMEDVARAIPGHDVVVVSLGQPASLVAASPGGSRITHADICEAGTRNIVSALGLASAVRVIAVTSFGVGDTRGKIPITLREIMADKERQEAVLKASDLDYVLVQPVALTDDPASCEWLESTTGETRRMRISRKDVAAFIAKEIANPRYHGQTVALSG